MISTYATRYTAPPEPVDPRPVLSYKIATDGATGAVRSDGEDAAADAVQRELIENGPQLLPKRRKPAESEAGVTTAGLRVAKKSEFSLAERPGFCEVGQPTTVEVNYYMIDSRIETNYHQYRIEFSHRTTEQVRRKLIETTARDHGPIQFVYDGDQVLLSAKSLPDVIKVALVDPRDLKKPADQQVKVEICIKKVAEINTKLINDYYKGRVELHDMPQATLNVINYVLRNRAAATFLNRGNNFYYSDGKRELGEGAEVWNGWHQAARATMSGLMLNVDISTTAVYKAVPVIDFVCALLRKDKRTLGSLLPNELKKVRSYLRYLKVTTSHSKRKDGSVRVSKYTVQGVSKDRICDIKFEWQKDTATTQETTIPEYFKDRYGVRLQYPNLPAIEQKGKDGQRLYIPFELCNIAENQVMAKQCTSDQVQSMLKFCTKKPVQRKKNLVDTIHTKAKLQDDPYAEAFGLAVDTEMAKVRACQKVFTDSCPSS